MSSIREQHIQSFKKKSFRNDPATSATAVLSRGSLFKNVQNSNHVLLIIYLDVNDFQLKCKSNNALKIAFKEIKDVRYGWNTDAFIKISSETGHQWKEDRCFSIVYGPKRQTLDLQAESVLIARSWISALLSVIAFTRFRQPKFSIEFPVNPEIKQIFKNYSGGDSLLASELLIFLQREQNMKELTEEDAQNLIDTFKVQADDRRTMTEFEFFSLISSPMFHILKDEHRKVNQDMAQPLNHYYIASSHNTYLTGDQLTSKSSIEGYIIALEQGCRCLEIDLWDGPANQPIVYHGYTRTSKILAKDVLSKGIKPFAFKYSDYPLVLSVENHLSLNQQKVFAEYLNETFKEHLYQEEVVGIPSPEKLKGKILIKATGAIVQCPFFKSLINVATSSVKELKSELQVNSLSEVEATNVFTRRSLSKDSPAIIRIYPAGARVRSENFNPVPYWNAGCSMVALNYQTKGKYLDMNFGMFRRNGNCGYVLKPDYVLNSIDPPEIRRKVVRLRIISAHNLKVLNFKHRKVEGCYIKVQFEGIDVVPMFKTAIIKKNSYYPYWNEVIEVKLKYPQSAIVCFTIKFVDESQNKFRVGSYVLPIESLSCGYRTVPLNDEFSNLETFASVLVHILCQD